MKAALPILDGSPTSFSSDTEGDKERSRREDGQGAEICTLRLSIEGMHCASCAEQVRSALQAVPGVKSAEVNFATHLATVVGQSTKPSERESLAAVSRAGYQAKPLQKREAGRLDFARFRQEMRAWFFRAFVAFSGLAILVMLHALHAGHSSSTRFLIWLVAASASLYAGAPFFRGAWKAVLAGRANMDVLIALGSSAALIAGTISTLQGGEQGYLHEGVTVLAFVCLGSYLETLGRKQAAGALHGLTMSRSTLARKKDKDGNWIETTAPEIVEQDILLIKPGERVPLDGLITVGKSGVDESWLTGESLPRTKGPGERLLAGSINGDGALEMRVTAPSGSTAWDEAMDLVVHAQASRPRIQRTADRIMAYFVPVLLFLAISAALYWVAQGNWKRGIDAFVAVVVVTCPCAVGLAAPLAVMAASGKAAKEGILVKSAETFETAAQLRTVVFDKTGTLTQGKPSLVSIQTSGRFSQHVLLQIAASLEQMSLHPLARGVCQAANAQGLSLLKASDLQVLPGLGVRGFVHWESEILNVSIGSAELLRQQNIPVTLPHEKDESTQQALGQPLYVVVDGRHEGVLWLSDELSEFSAEAVRTLQSQGLNTVLLSGDRKEAVAYMASRLGIARAQGELRPDEKYGQLVSLRSEGSLVMVGDGLNDAPALAGADLGVAMGTGADAAQATADVILVSHDLRKLPRLLEISRSTVAVIWQNLGWALVYNLLAVPLAASGSIPPWAAAAAMSASSVSVVLNSLRLRWL